MPLSDAFLQEIAKSFGRPPAGLTRDAREALLRHDWPGNVRELRNALERAAILSEGALISAEDLSLYARRPILDATTDLNAVARDTIEQVMRECRGNKSKAAKRLGLSRTQLYGRRRKYRPSPGRPDGGSGGAILRADRQGAVARRSCGAAAAPSRRAGG